MIYEESGCRNQYLPVSRKHGTRTKIMKPQISRKFREEDTAERGCPPAVIIIERYAECRGSAWSNQHTTCHFSTRSSACHPNALASELIGQNSSFVLPELWNKSSMVGHLDQVSTLLTGKDHFWFCYAPLLVLE